MSGNRKMVHSLMFLLFKLAGCSVWELDEDSVAAGSTEHAIVAMNGQLPGDLGFASQHMDWLRLNALTTNPSAVSSMTGHPLHSSVYDDDWQGQQPPNDYLITQLCDPYARQVMKRVVECALDGGKRGVPAQSVTWLDHESGQTETWHGSIGLCPAWHQGPPSVGCLERVSACVLARLNEQGKAVSISMRGWQSTGQTLPVPASEVATHPRPDGAFFGNLFDPAGINEISVQVTSCDSEDAGLAYTDTAGESPRQYFFVLPSVSGPTTNMRRDEIHHLFLDQSGFVRVVYEKAFACWDPLASPTQGMQSGRVCTGLVPELDCAVTSVGDCSVSCAPALDPGGVRYYQQCLDDNQAPWRWPLDVFYFYKYGAGL
jgi:hypothetical protein